MVDKLSADEHIQLLKLAEQVVPGIEAYQQGRLILKRIADIPSDAIPSHGLPDLESNG